jgi:hypothetical protein
VVFNESSDSFERRATGSDFEKTLQHAELLLDKIDNARKSITQARGASAALLTLIAFATAVAVTFSSSAFRTGFLIGIGALAIIAAAGLTSRTILPLNQQIRRDELTMVDLVETMRELLPLLADEEKWSYAQNRLAETRLERFPIGVERSGSYRWPR